MLLTTTLKVSAILLSIVLAQLLVAGNPGSSLAADSAGNVPAQSLPKRY